MLDKKTILETSLILASIGLVLFAYRLSNWVLYDLGWLSISIYTIVSSYKNVIKSIVAWIFLSLVLNSLITSLFFDVTIFGINQKIFGVVVGTASLTYGIVYNYFKHYYDKKQVQANIECRKDAKDKYKSLINRMESMEGKMDEKLNTFDNFLNKLANG